MLSVGIIGLPNVGKSTLFNALTAGKASVSNYPFTTIDSNVGMAAVPDRKLYRLERLLRPKETVPCFIQFVDIAGLVQGASEGEGLGNQFLDKIRQVDALAEVVRCFQAPEVAHLLPGIDFVRDVEIVETELLLADLQVSNGVIEKKQKIWKTNPRRYTRERERWLGYLEKLELGIPLRNLSLDSKERRILKGLGLLTGKPVVYVANISENEVGQDGMVHFGKFKECGQRILCQQEVVSIAAQFEWELLQLNSVERHEFMEEVGMIYTGLERLVRKAFKILGLIRFYTITNGKLRAWEVEAGTKAPEGAGKVHSDMEKGFIRAQVASVEDLMQFKNLEELSQCGKVRTQGKDYVIQDGDVINFLFSNQMDHRQQR